jgi:hypothetical protein
MRTALHPAVLSSVLIGEALALSLLVVPVPLWIWIAWLVAAFGAVVFAQWRSGRAPSPGHSKKS